MTEHAPDWDIATPSRLAGNEIRAELARQGHNQRWLAEQLFVTQAWVSRRISPTSDVELTLEELARIAVALQVPVQRLLGVLLLAETPSTLVRSYLTALAPVVDLDAYRAERAA